MAEERRIRTVFEVAGAEAAAEAVERLAEAFTETELAEVEANAQTLAFEEAIASAEQEARRFAATQSRTSSATSQLSGAAREGTQQAMLFTQRVQGAATAAQALAQAIGAEGAGTALIGRMLSLSSVGTQVGQLFGPTGAVVGGIAGLATATIPALIEALFGVPPAQEIVEAATNRTTQALQAEAQAARDAVGELNAFLTAASTAGRRREAQRGEEAIRDLIAQRDRLRGTGRAIDALEAQGLDDRIRQLSRQVQEELDEIASEEQQLRRAAQQRQASSRDALAEEQAAWEAYNTAVLRGLQQEQEARQRRIELMIETGRKAREEGDRLIAEMVRVHNKRIEVGDEQREREREAHDEARRQNELLIESNREAYQKSRDDTAETAALVDAASRGMASAISEVIAGTKSAEDAFKGLLAGFLQTIAEQALTKAAFEYAEGVAAFARQDYAGGVQHVAAGVAFTGVAIATGAAAGALSAPSPQADRPDRARPADDTGGRTVYVNNWNAPQVVAGTEADVGRTLDRLGRRATQRFGRLAA